MFNQVDIDIRKLKDYCLNPDHPLGKHKARLFYSKLGLKRKNAEVLKNMISERIREAEIKFEFEDKYGKRYSAEIRLYINNKAAYVKTIWIIKKGEEIPSLVTCYIII